MVPQLASTQSYMPHSFNLSLTPYSNQPHNEESLSDSQRIPATAMGPPAKRRKRKAPTLRADAWEPYKARITELHVRQKLPLRQVKDTIERESSFQAGIRQYRTRISQWGLDKNIKPHEMSAVVRKRQRRKLIESQKGELTFTVRGNEVEPQKIDRWMKRNEIPENVVYAPSPAAYTPSACRYRQTDEDRLRQELSTLEIRYEDDHPETLRILYKLSEVLIDQGRYSSAEKMIRRLVEARQNVNGSDDNDMNEALDLLGGVLYFQGSYAKAERLHRRAFESSRRILGSEHPNTLRSMDYLAITYCEQGRLKEAEELWVQVKQGRLKEAEELEVQVIETRKRVLGHEHPDTLISISNLASTYSEQGRLKEAEELEVQVIETRKRVLGDEHLDTLISISNLASTYSNQGRLKEAEALKVQVVETRKRVLGHEHPDTLLSMSNLAFTDYDQGRLKEAEEL
ncbi:hypothetical protein B0A49_12511 [Cryomyces minteri]|uniref:Clr5 domain-containing protein n=1 Tax=Cryomyces minteri TaxID=331657 RepID=A0A4U0VRE0_9PEZI|nr:hypothetical protein B0A49_12511 [Cryomyces minteri]